MTTDRIGTQPQLERRIAQAPDGLDSALPPRGEGYHQQVWKAKRRIVLAALQDADYSFTDAAKALGINRTYLHRLVRKLNLREAVCQLFPRLGKSIPGRTAVESSTLH